MPEYDVLAIGELNVDIIMTGLKSMPIMGREIIAEDCSVVLGSSTAIFACGVAKLGLKTGFHGLVGDDDFGKTALESLGERGVDTSNVIIDKDIKTGVTLSLSMEKDRALITHLGSIEALKLENINLDLLDKTRHIHVGSFFLQNNLRPGLPELFRIAKEKGITTSLDAGWDDTENWDYGIRDTLKYTDIFFPNEVEAINISGKNNVENALLELGQYANTVVVKCGPEGAAAIRDGKIVKSPTFSELKPIDTTGAGDSFNAGFVYGHINGLSLEECMVYGNACGSISVTRIGGATSCASLDEVKKLIDTYGKKA